MVDRQRRGDRRLHARNEELADRLLFWAVIVDAGLLAVFGGGPPGPIVTMAIAVAATAVTACLEFSPAARERQLSPGWRTLLVAMPALPALQLIPLPPAWWHALPGGGDRQTVLALIGAANSWQPLSIVPLDTAAAAVLAFAFAVLVGALVALRDRQFTGVLVALGILALLNISVGILQAGSGGSPHLLARADHGALLGFFANKNHAGLAVAASLALFVRLTDLLPVFGPRRRLWLGGASGLALICAVATNSRAGLALTLGVAVWVALRFITAGRLYARLGVLGGGAALAGLLFLSPIFERVYNRFGDVGQDLRWRFAEQSWPLAQQYGVLGSGGGSFQRLFILNEQLPWVKPTVVNEAHDEYLQTLIEYGAPGVALLLVAFVALGWTARRRWRVAAPGTVARRQLEAGMVIVLLFAVHSAIDYPLRRPASWAVFAAGCAMIVRGRRPDVRDGTPPTRVLS